MLFLNMFLKILSLLDFICSHRSKILIQHDSNEVEERTESGTALEKVAHVARGTSCRELTVVLCCRTVLSEFTGDVTERSIGGSVIRSGSAAKVAMVGRGSFLRYATKSSRASNRLSRSFIRWYFVDLSNGDNSISVVYRAQWKRFLTGGL